MDNLPRIAVLLNHWNAFDRGIIRGVSKYIKIHGSFLIFSDVAITSRKDEDLDLVTRLKAWQPDGILFRDTSITEDIFSLNKPTIVIPQFSEYPGYTNITSNNLVIGEWAAMYFLKKGYKNYGFSGYPEYEWSNVRLEGYKKVLAESGFEVFDYQKHYGGNIGNWESEKQFLLKWLQELPKPIAIFCVSDSHARVVVDALRILSIMIPQEVAILGVDNDEVLCDLTIPSISSIVQSCEVSGYEAISRLGLMIENDYKGSEPIIVEPAKIMERQSTDVYAVEDKLVQKALYFIRNTAASKRISIADVTDYVRISRRSLEWKFRKQLNHSILDEIKMVKIEKIKQLLLETDYTVQQIAFEVGLSTDDNFSRYFRSVAGMSPERYRMVHRISSESPC